MSFWEATAQKTDPTFTGGTLPTGFSGTYGTDMIPNKTYFVITAGDALGNGATLGDPYEGSIGQAGLAVPEYRPEGAYDIGAYQYTTEETPAAAIGKTFYGVSGNVSCCQ